MKKSYITPTIKIRRIELTTFIAGSGDFKVSNNDADTNSAVLGNGRRGSWGDLWGNGEEE